MEDLIKRCKAVDKLALDIQKLETNNTSLLFPDLGLSSNKISLERAILKEKTNEAEEDMLKMFTDCPTPSMLILQIS